MYIFKLSIREIITQKLFSILMFVVCLVGIYTILSAVTNAASTAYQKADFTNSIGYNFEEVLHIDYLYTLETEEFALELEQFREYIKSLEGVKSVGMFDMTGVHFSELRYSNEYLSINGELLKTSKYADHPHISRLLNVDEELLSFVKGGISNYSSTQTEYTPIFASEAFSDIIHIGDIITEERTGEKYEIMGFFPVETQWVSEDDLIRYPKTQLDAFFIAPFTEEQTTDIMTQLSCLHNTYALLSEGADINKIILEIEEYAKAQGFAATAITLEDEYGEYNLETESFVGRQIILAVFICAMAISGVIALFTTNTLLKRKQYGVLVAHGYTQLDILKSIVTEIFIIVCSSGLTAWIIQYLNFVKSYDLFQSVMIQSHCKYTLPICICVILFLTIIGSVLPAIKLFKYQVSELLGGDANGNY